MSPTVDRDVREDSEIVTKALCQHATPADRVSGDFDGIKVMHIESG
jgi:hypothetical protein